MRTQTLSVLAGAFLALARPATAEEHLVHDQAEYHRVAAHLRPGDVVKLADGEWRDFRILLEGRGRPGKPITLTAETTGGVILSGQSNLRLAGEHLVVSGLVFRSGYTATEEVIAFRRDSNALASHSRVTQVVIDRFNQPDRRREDRWVSLYGQFNRVDHSHFEGKTNAGVTLAVIRRAGQPPDNRHRIDHNYFGPRPPLGSNGGETVRIGTSEESLSDSHTVLENNYFDRCSGEIEIVSNKSGGNTLRGNVFFESQGALVLRHGSGNLVEGNVFLGNDKAHTGGIRIINSRQTVRGNYMEGLAGGGFASALTVMNGVPDSPINRYHQVTDTAIERNTVIDSARITLGAGADAERSLPPVKSRFADNLIVDREGDDPFRIEADVSGIIFAGNVQSAAPEPQLRTGVARRPVALARADNGLLYPTDPALADVGAPRAIKPISRNDTGVAWYPKPAGGPTAFDSGQTIQLAPCTDCVLAQRIAALPGDAVIQLAAGRYVVETTLVIDKALTIAGPKDAGIATLLFTRATLFQIEPGGALRLQRVTISGAQAPNTPGNAVIRTSDSPTAGNYEIEIADSRFAGLDGAAGFDVIATTPGTLASGIAIDSSRFDGVSGAVIDARSELGDKGYYNAERVVIRDSRFRKVGRVADLLRGGRDESTFGPRFVLQGSVIALSGDPAHPSVRLSGVQFAEIAGNEFVESGGVEVIHSVGAPQTLIARNLFRQTPMPKVRELYFKGPPRALLQENVARNER